MDVLLVGITGISLLLATAMGLVLFKLLRDEQRRSDARVALLRAAAAESPGPVREPDWEVPGPEAEAAPPLRDEMFAVREAASAWSARAAIGVAMAVAIGACLALAAYALAPDVTRQTAPAVSASGPLELLALRHEQGSGKLTVSGVVRHPRAGGGLSQVVATAFAFGADGALLATGRSHLDYATLRPGDESPFVINVLVSGAVSRYRVGFRSTGGEVIPHVDRRFDGTSVRNDDVAGSVPWVP